MAMLSKNILLTFLYFIQGLPYGFQTSFLPIVLRTHGISLTKLGFFRMLFLPWLCRAMWAPLVDMYGTKLKWLLASIIGLLLTCLLGSLGSPDDLIFLCVVLLLLNVFSATQDIVVDGVAVAILASDELGGGNTAQVVGYKIGAIFGGGVLIWLMNAVGWTGMFLGLALLYLEALMFVYVSPELREFEQQQVLLQPSVGGNDNSGADIDPQMEQERGNWTEANELPSVNRGIQFSASSFEGLRNRFYSTFETFSGTSLEGARNRFYSTFETFSSRSLEGETANTEQDVEQQGVSKTWLSILHRVVDVPGTEWMLVYVLMYKLGTVHLRFCYKLS